MNALVDEWMSDKGAELPSKNIPIRHLLSRKSCYQLLVKASLGDLHEEPLVFWKLMQNADGVDEAVQKLMNGLKCYDQYLDQLVVSKLSQKKPRSYDKVARWLNTPALLEYLGFDRADDLLLSIMMGRSDPVMIVDAARRLSSPNKSRFVVQ